MADVLMSAECVLHGLQSHRDHVKQHWHTAKANGDEQLTRDYRHIFFGLCLAEFAVAYAMASAATEYPEYEG